MYQVLEHLGVRPSEMSFMVHKSLVLGSMTFQTASESLNSVQKEYLLAFLVALYSTEGSIKRSDELELKFFSKHFDVPVMSQHEALSILNSDDIKIFNTL